MDVEEYSYRSKLMRVVKARDQLNLMKAAAYPKMEAKSQKKYFESIYNEAFPKELTKPKTASNEQAFSLFKRMANHG